MPTRTDHHPPIEAPELAEPTNGHPHHSHEELEPVAVAGEEIEADPQDLEDLLLGDSELLQKAIQAILLLEPDAITPSQVATGLGIPPDVAKRGLEGARVRLADEGLIVVGGAGSYRLGTHPEVASILEQYFKRSRRRRMSRAMLETMAIIACQGPVTRAEIEAIRGVNVDSILARCLDQELIEVTGQKETPGRPLLYGVTEGFLRYFGMEDVEELQTMLPAEWANLPRQTLLELEEVAGASAELPEPVATIDDEENEGAEP